MDIFSSSYWGLNIAEKIDDILVDNFCNIKKARHKDELFSLSGERAGLEDKNQSSELIFPTDESLLVCKIANITNRVSEAI